MANCKICNKPSGFFPLCKSCFALRDEGKIEKCEECNTWHYNDKACNCEKKEIISLEAEKPLTQCLLCKNEANGFLFCKDCYHKYKNKEIILKISKCTNIELLEVYYEGKKYISDDGHIVKSLGELLIDNYLYKENIKHTYERGYYISADVEIKPDWYLPELDLFIEHWGINKNENYDKQKEFKLKNYKENNKTVVCTYEEDLQNLSTELERKLNYKFLKKNTINFLKE